MKRKIVEISRNEIKDLIQKLENASLDVSDHKILKDILVSYLGLNDEILDRKASILREKRSRTELKPWKGYHLFTESLETINAIFKKREGAY